MSQTPNEPEHGAEPEPAAPPSFGTPPEPGGPPPAPPAGDSPPAPSAETPPGFAPPPPPPPPAPNSGQPAGYGQYGTPMPPPFGQAQSQLSPGDERTWGMLAHLSALLGLFITIPFLGPLIVYLVYRDRSAYVRRQSAEALNFNISIAIYFIVSAILWLVIIGIFLSIALFVYWLVEVIIASVAANRGEEHRYPLTIRFVH